MKTLRLGAVLIIGYSLATGCSERDGNLFKSEALLPMQEHMKSTFLPETAKARKRRVATTVPAIFHQYEREEGASKRAVRDEMIDGLLSIADYDYGQYELNLSGATRLSASVADLMVLGLTTSATITGGEQAKTVLSGIAAFVSGGRTIITKEAMYDQSLPLLLARMRSLRKFKRNFILEELRTKGIADYSLYRALGDVYDYCQAGTITSAIADIARETAEQEEFAATGATSAATRPIGDPD